MPNFELRRFQRDCLEVLANYCADVRTRAASGAARPERDAFEAVRGMDTYFTTELFAGTPYVCLRVPTGGGKTLIGAHALGQIARSLGRNERPLCLWVTPSTTIRDQTLRGLKDRNHAYHLALRESFGRPCQIMTIEEAQQASRSMMGDDPVVIVTTIQSYRIDDPAARKVYQDNGYLMDHFSALPEWVRERLRPQEPGSDQRVALSLANVLKLRGPIVLIDEAQNARTRTSFESLSRFGPLAVLELTATPNQVHDPAREKFASNVLHAVSALAVQHAGLIKLPIVLESRSDWLDVLALTIERRNQLEAIAARFVDSSGRRIRPIALIQAQPESKARENHTPARVVAELTRDDGPFRIPREQIRIAYRDEKLGDEDLLSDDCPVRYVVTVEMVREGWDCPFAYVLGSVGNVATPTAVEQLLGRVLRMPHAAPTEVLALDRAYAVVQSENVATTALGLRDKLIETCGFDATSAQDALRVELVAAQPGGLPMGTIRLSEPPRAGALPAAVAAKVSIDERENIVHVAGQLTRDEAASLRDAMQTLEDRTAVETYWTEQRPVGTAAKPIDEYAASMRVPQLSVRYGERVVLFEPEELDEFEWNLDTCDHALPDFDLNWRAGQTTLIGTAERGGVNISPVQDVIVSHARLFDDQAARSARQTSSAGSTPNCIAVVDSSGCLLRRVWRGCVACSTG